MTKLSVPRAVRLACLVVIALAGRGAFADPAPGVGLAAFTVEDPINGGRMDGYVFYPSTQRATGPTKVSLYQVAAALDAPAQPGAKPLVVLSHGNGGGRLDLHGLATYLAGHGFVVAAFDHPKDNFRDSTGAGHPEVLAGRSIQVAAVITYLLQDARWQPLIDRERIGVAGFSAGGYTSLLVVGAVPRFDLIVGYCQRHPDDKVFCAELKQQPAALKGRLAELSAGLTRWGATADPRVKAAFAMAPLSLFFDAAGLRTVDRPVFLYYGEHDQLLLPAENALHIKPWLKTLVSAKAVAKADHFVFLTPCSAELAKAVPVICADPPGVDRAAVSAQIAADALAFFRKTLAAPTSPPAR